MRNSSTTTVLSAVCLVVIATARADVVHRRDGSKVEGTVFHQTGDMVAIQKPRGGIVTVQRSELARIEWSDPSRRPEEGVRLRPEKWEGSLTTKKPTSDGFFPAPPAPQPSQKSQRKSKGRTSRVDLETSLAELDAIRLRRWDESRPHTATECNKYICKYVTDQGARGLSKRRPPSPQGYREVWGRRFYREYSTYRQPIGVHGEWIRLYWDKERRRWTETSPARSDFSRFKRLSKSFLTDVVRGTGAASSRMFAAASRLQRRSTKRIERRDLEAKLRRLARQAGGEWSGDDLILRAHELAAELARSSSVGRSLELARELRDVCREIVRRYPPDA